MAPPATDALRSFVDLLRPAPGRFAYALRIALACAATAYVILVYQTPAAALTTYLVFFMNQRDRTSTALLCAGFPIVMAAVLGMILLIAQQVIGDAAWRVAAIAVSSSGLVYLASASKLRRVAAIVALVTTYALAQIGSAQGGEVATREILYVWLFFAIPGSVSIVLALTLAPAPQRLAERELSRRLRAAARVLERSPADVVSGNSSADKHLFLAKLEHSVDAQQLAALGCASIAERVAAHAVTLAATAKQPNRRAIARALETLADRVDGRLRPMIDPLPSADDERSTPALAIQAIEQALHLADAAPSPSTPPAKRSGLFDADAFTNPAHLRYALKTTAAAMICYLTYQLLDWPGIHTCLVTCYVVSLTVLADTIEKLLLRIAGCLVGAALGIGALVSVVPHLTHGGELCLLVFTGALLGAWVAAGSARIAYAGFQLAFAFFLCVLQDPAPSFDLTVARDRIIGILFGNAVVYLMSTGLWPTSVGARIEARLATAVRALADVLRSTHPAVRHRLVIQAETALAAASDDLTVVAYEPSRVRPSPGWVESRHARWQHASRLLGPAIVAAATEQPWRASIAQRLDRLGQPDAAADFVAEGGPLLAIVERHLRGIERAVHAKADPYA